MNNGGIGIERTRERARLRRGRKRVIGAPPKPVVVASVDDLRSRGVLGEKIFERIRDLVSAG